MEVREFEPGNRNDQTEVDQRPPNLKRQHRQAQKTRIWTPLWPADGLMRERIRPSPRRSFE